jgi:hypothetical protein
VEDALERFGEILPLYDEVGVEQPMDGDQVAQALETFLERNIDWLAESYNRSRGE